MKRLKGKTVAALLSIVLVVAAGVGAVRWVGTSQGSRWLLSSLAALSDGGFSVRKMEGTIGDRLLLTDVRVRAGRLRLDTDSLELRWQPILLLMGTVAVRELTLEGVRIRDDTPPSPDLVWPQLPPWTRLLDVRIGRLRVSRLSYATPGQAPLRVNSLSAAVNWHNMFLCLGALALSSPDGRITGAVSAGLGRPSLTCDLVISPAQPVARMSRICLRTRPGRGTGGELIAGQFSLAGGDGAGKLLEFGGEAGMTRSGFNLRRLRLSRPGHRGVVSADGSLLLTPREPRLNLRIRAAGLDLAPELKQTTDLSGTLTFRGTPARYGGDFTLSNRGQGWRSATLSATCRGTGEGMRLTPLRGRVLDGSVTGNLDLDWRDGLVLSGTITGNGLNPARLSPDWKGVANFRAAGSLAWSGKAPPRGNVTVALLESRLHGKTLAGDLQARVGDHNLSLTRLYLRGKGFDLAARGELNQRIDLTARVGDFSRIIPGSSGRLTAGGWVRWAQHRLSGAVSATGTGLAHNGARIKAASLNARLERGAGYPLHVSGVVSGVTYGGLPLKSVTFSADGSLTRHTIGAMLRSADGEARLALAAGYGAGLWRGEITGLAGRDAGGPWNLTAPARFAVGAGKLSLSPLILTASAAEQLELSVDLLLQPLNGQARLRWSGLNLARANAHLKGVSITGSSQGTLRVGLLSGKRLSLEGSASANGTFTTPGGNIGLRRGQVSLVGGEGGVRAALDLVLANDGSLKGTFSSSAPLGLAVPEGGKLTAEWSGMDLSQLKPWLPPDVALNGRVSGSMGGNVLPGRRLELDGNARLSGGTVQRKRTDGELNLACRTAALSWGWRGETLTGTISLTMERYGQSRAVFQVPLAARFPLAVNHEGPLRVSLSGKLQEKGVLSSLFPGVLQESFGELDADLAIGGTWRRPHTGGTLRLARAGARLPSAGIRLKEVQLTARLEKDLVRILSFRAESGPGHLEGMATVTLDDWRVTGYRGSLGGDNFQTVHFPELQMLCTPKLSFEGTPRKLVLRGELRLPDVRITGSVSNAVVTPSSDVILEGSGVPAAKSPPLHLDGRVRVLMGERVFVKLGGIDARLGGAVDLSLNGLDRITSSGEIKVIKGRYRTYGVNLDLVRGRLFFAGGPVERPALDFLALRTIGDVRAGVTVAGTLQKPVTRLYSEPGMPDVDILAYIVLGHPLSGGGEEAGLLSRAAGALLGSSQAAVLYDRLKDRLGLSTLEVQKGTLSGNGSMGYKPIRVSNIESATTGQQNGMAETMLTVGKYLTPQLYFSYGNSLFTGGSLFRLRYDISRRWQVESQTGSESGVDIFYKLEFR